MPTILTEEIASAVPEEERGHQPLAGRRQQLDGKRIGQRHAAGERHHDAEQRGRGRGPTPAN